MNLVFLGSGEFGLPTLAHLAARHALRAVVTQPDRPAGRGGRLTPTPVARWAAEHAPGIPLLKPERVNAPEVVAQIKACKPDALVVIAFGQKIGRAVLDRTFAVNLHASLLPRWRGAAPINAAILAGDPGTGNSVIALADRMDAGAVYGQSHRPIYPDLTAGELHDLLAADGPALIERVLVDARAGRLDAREQDESLVTLAPKLSKADGWVDFGQSGEECRRRIHGLTPWPGVAAMLSGAKADSPASESELKLARAQVAMDPDAEHAGQSAPGTILDPERGLVACGGGTVLRLLEVQPPGKRRMPWADFVRGNPVQRGAMLIGKDARP